MSKDLRLNIVLPDKFGKDATKHAKEFGYTSVQELLRESLREKIYGKTREKEISNKFLEQIEKEKEYIFKENKDIHERLKKILKQF